MGARPLKRHVLRGVKMADMPRGRRTKGPSERAAYRLPSVDLDRLRKLAILENVTTTAAMEQAVRLFVDLREHLDGQAWTRALGTAMAKNETIGQHIAGLLGPSKHQR